MKRIIILIDGTWDKEGSGGDTNVAKLDPGNSAAGSALIKALGDDGLEQRVVYHAGVGTDDNLFKRWLGGAIGLGLKALVLDAYGSLVNLYENGDDIFVIGFSRGAYAARALVGMIGASGIVRHDIPANREAAWAHYRVRPSVRLAPDTATGADAKAINDLKSLHDADGIHPDNRVKCVAVWETVGSYGVPAGFGLAPLARYIALATLGFHDTSLGDHVEVGLHAVGIDERRRPFVPTFWTIRKGQRPKGAVEQTWFAGEHGNVGGGQPDSGLSNEALLWMIARMQALTALKFDIDAVKVVAAHANVDGEVYDSTKGWFIDHTWPHLRKVLSPDAIVHGYFTNSIDDSYEHINEWVHWSAIKKRGRRCTIFGSKDEPYAPPNLPQSIPNDKIADITAEERIFLGTSSEEA
jgi:uncharacterized protein (DUF2235 family)